MMADYSDVVPRREFERMETAYKVHPLHYCQRILILKMETL